MNKVYKYSTHIIFKRISYLIPTPCWLSLSLLISFWVDIGSDMNRFPTKPSKTIDPPGKPKGNVARKAHSVVSPEIDLWVTAITRCL
jgi:hypothetical protein